MGQIPPSLALQGISIHAHIKTDIAFGLNLSDYFKTLPS